MSYFIRERSQDVVGYSKQQKKGYFSLKERFYLMEMRKSRGPGEESSYFLPTLEQ